MAVGADNWAAAPTIGVGESSDPTPNDALTVEPGEGEGYGGRTAWWKITPPTSGTLVFDTELSTPSAPRTGDTRLAIYAPNSSGGLTELNVTDDISRTNWLSRLAHDVTAGQTYYVQVDGYAAGMVYVLRVRTASFGPWVERAGWAGDLTFTPDGSRSLPVPVVGGYLDLNQIWFGARGAASAADGVDRVQDAWDLARGYLGRDVPHEGLDVSLLGADTDARTRPDSWRVGGRSRSASRFEGDSAFSPTGADFSWNFLAPVLSLGADDTPPTDPNAVRVEYDTGASNPGGLLTASWSVEAQQIDTYVPPEGDPGTGLAFKVEPGLRISHTPQVPLGDHGTLTEDQWRYHWPYSVLTTADGAVTETVTAVGGRQSIRVMVFPETLYSGTPTAGPERDIVRNSGRVEFIVHLNVTRPRYRFLYPVDGTPTPPAPTPVPPTRVTPSLRMLQRGGSGGMSGIPRMVGDPTRRGIRQGPGSIY